MSYKNCACQRRGAHRPLHTVVRFNSPSTGSRSHRRGKDEYQRYCAICHGVDSQGQGIMAKYLTIGAPDLTMLARKNGGKSPFWETYGVIDGRKDVRAHGTREMPIWGARFQAAAGNDRAGRAQVMGEILSLVSYLQSLQQ